MRAKSPAQPEGGFPPAMLNNFTMRRKPRLSFVREILVRLAFVIVLAPLALAVTSCGGDGGSSPPPTLVSIEISPSGPAIPKGLAQQFKATGVFSDASRVDVTNAAVWSSGAPTVAIVNVTSGLANALTEGTTVITATVISAPTGPVAGNTTVTVSPPVLRSIAITPDPAQSVIGLTLQFRTTGTFSDASTADISGSTRWSSATPAVATIDANSGLASSLTTGTSVITAAYTDGTVSLSDTVTLAISAATVQSISITPNPAFSGIALVLQLTATGTFSDNTTADVTALATWTSASPAVVTVGAWTGMTTGIALGSSTITATIGSVNATTPLSIVSGVWSPAGKPVDPLYGAGPVVLLPTGKVLVTTVSGASLDRKLRGQLYDPVVDRWSRTGSFDGQVGCCYVGGYEGSQGTLLPNGKVLIAGGRASMSFISGSAFLYDSFSGTTSATGGMVPRNHHTLTLLSNGKVLAVGGVQDVLASAFLNTQLYDPATGTWSTTGDLLVRRGAHTATLLPNGKVLVVGGCDSSDPNFGCSTAARSAELYDPITGTWALAGSALAARGGHTATLLPDGKVLVVGGFELTAGEVSLAGAALFDPASGTWSPTGSLLTARRFHSATLLTNGKVLVAGGLGSGPAESANAIANAELYDPISGTWSITGNLASAGGGALIRLPNGKVLIARPTPELYW